MQLLGEGGTEAYYNNAILLTGFTGLITMIPCLYFYRKDRRARIAGGLVTGQKPNRLGIGECGLILVMGAGFAQFANMFVNMIGSFLNAEEYQETMSQLTDGKSMFFLIVCMGIIAPLAEEIVFRWLIYLRLRDYMRSGAAIVISGLFFGIIMEIWSRVFMQVYLDVFLRIFLNRQAACGQVSCSIWVPIYGRWSFLSWRHGCLIDIRWESP